MFNSRKEENLFWSLKKNDVGFGERKGVLRVKTPLKNSRKWENFTTFFSRVLTIVKLWKSKN